MTHTTDRALVWFRRDLRATDHAALYHALRHAREVWCVFIYDRKILDPLPRQDRRVGFIHASITALDAALGQLRPGVRLLARHGDAVSEITALARQLGVQAVYANHDDEPQALSRDAAVRAALASAGIALHTSKDHVVFERSEILTQSGTPYTVYTPYKNAWLRKLEPFYVRPYPVEKYAAPLAPPPPDVETRLPTLASLGFAPAETPVAAGPEAAQALLDVFIPGLARYGDARDYPALDATSRLSVHLRFGTVSVRALAAAALADDTPGARVWLSELIWRDFYHQILHHHPHVVGHSFKPDYDRIKWESGPQAQAMFEAWCEGRTGYPLVDAAMAQINRTGFMHNRLRMVVASFLTKDLGLDWRWGEAYFAAQLNDYDLAANNGGWQWAASTGCDAQPYFRIFNPVTQSRKFDPDGAFIRQQLPQLASLPDSLVHTPWVSPIECPPDYPAAPIVDHDAARQRTLARYAVVK